MYLIINIECPIHMNNIPVFRCECLEVHYITHIKPEGVKWESYLKKTFPSMLEHCSRLSP